MDGTRTYLVGERRVAVIDPGPNVLRHVRALALALEPASEVSTDRGALRAVHTPGHTPEHLCFHWLPARALFAGDLMLGEGDTTWVAEYTGCMTDYLASLDGLRSLELEVIYPAHGPPLDDPEDAIRRFADHKRVRIRQVEEALKALPGSDVDALLDHVYGDTIPSGLRPAAARSLGALVDYVRGIGPT